MMLKSCGGPTSSSIIQAAYRRGRLETILNVVWLELVENLLMFPILCDGVDGSTGVAVLTQVFSSQRFLLPACGMYHCANKLRWASTMWCICYIVFLLQVSFRMDCDGS
jgi:hypothetical protein